MKKGLIHIYTGEGKGKTTASIGLAVRAKSRGLKVLFIQLMKTDYTGGELDLLQKIGIETKRCKDVKSPHFHPDVDTVEVKGFSFKALQEVLQNASDFDLIVVDEFNYLLSTTLISEEEAIDFIKNFPEGTELVLTGQGATDRLISLADYVTYMKAIKHPFMKSIGARKGIEY